MTTERVLAPHRRRRRPRPGCFFTGLRVAGWLLIGFGLLLFVIGLVGFVLMLLLAGPTILDTLQHLDEQMAGFVLMLILVNLAVFPILGLVGAGLLGVGLASIYLAAEPAGTSAADAPAQREAA